MSYRSKTYTWNDVILVKRSMIRFFLVQRYFIQCRGWGEFLRHVGENIQTLSHWNTDVRLALQMQQKRTPYNNTVTRNATEITPLPSITISTQKFQPSSHQTSPPPTHHVQLSPSCMHLQTATCSLFLRRNRLQFWLDNLATLSFDLRRRIGTAC